MAAVKMSLRASYALCDILEHMIFESEGKEREFPFGVKYKLQRNFAQVSKDANFIIKERDNLIRKYGAPQKDEDGNEVISVTQENLDTYNKELTNLTNTIVEHDFLKFTIEETTNYFNNVETLNVDQMDLFISCMVEDPVLEDELKSNIEISKETKE